MSESLASRLAELELGELPGCSVAKIISGLDDETARTLTRVLEGPASTRSIWQALKQERYKIDRTTIQMHRDNRCICNDGSDS